MKEFNIDNLYLKNIIIREEWNMYTKDGRIPTHEELLLILQGKGQCSMTRDENHPEFEKLRTQLESEGYIHIERGWSNGDRVKKPFKLNGVRFETGEQFSCAAAMKYRLERG